MTRRESRQAKRIGQGLFLAALLAAATPAPAFESVDDPRAWALTGLSIVDVETGEIATDRTVVIRSGVIVAVGDRSVLPDSAAIVLDYSGHYAIPGLWDMHVHMRGGTDLIAANERWLPQYLGFGVTGVREAGGDMPNSVLHWKAVISEGDLAGPRIFSALRKLDGPGARQSGSIPVDSPEAVAAALDNLVFAGADFIKLYELSFPPELFVPALAMAEARGLRTAAHVSLYVPLYDLVDAGLDSFEHVFFLMKAANPDDREIAARLPVLDPLVASEYFLQYVSLADGADEAYARRTFRKMAAQGTAITPTLYIERAANDFMHGRPVDVSRAAEAPADLELTLELTVEAYEDETEQMLPSSDLFIAHARRFLAMAAEEGVTILAGSDTGAGNAWLYPGDSLHRELETLVDFGLTPLQALRAATIDAAGWLGFDRYFGTIEESKGADLVVLTANPLDDIANARSIAAVVQQGVYFDAERLKALRSRASP